MASEPAKAPQFRSRIAVGSTTHTRFIPVKNSFTYPVYVYLLDLDELPLLSSKLKTFGYNTWRPVSFYDSDYLSAPEAPSADAPMPGTSASQHASSKPAAGAASGSPKLPHGQQARFSPQISVKQKVLNFLRYNANIDPSPITRIELVTSARYFGYVFNPVSFYYCYAKGPNRSSANNIKLHSNSLAGPEESLYCFIAEVNNTFGEKHCYVLHGDNLTLLELSSPSPFNYAAHGCASKAFHVSPFSDISGTYDFKLADARRALKVNINQLNSKNELVLATFLSSDQYLLEVTDANLLRVVTRFPVSAFLTFPRIAFEAFKIHYMRKLPVYEKPNPASGDTIGTIPATNVQTFAMDQLLNAMDTLSKHVKLEISVELPSRVRKHLGSLGSPHQLSLRVFNYQFFVRMYDKPSVAFLESLTAGDFDCDSTACLALLLSQSSTILADAEKRLAIQNQAVALLEPRGFISDSLQAIGTEFDKTFATFDQIGIQISVPELFGNLIKRLDLQKTDEFLEIGAGIGGVSSLQIVATYGCNATIAVWNSLKPAVEAMVAKNHSVPKHGIKVISIERLFSEANEYFGKFTKVLVGEGFNAIAERLKSDAFISTLHAITKREGLVAMRFLASEVPSGAIHWPVASSASRMRGALGRLNYRYEQYKGSFSSKLLDLCTSYVTNPFKLTQRLSAFSAEWGLYPNKFNISSTDMLGMNQMLPSIGRPGFNVCWMGSSASELSDLMARRQKSVLDWAEQKHLSGEDTLEQVRAYVGSQALLRALLTSKAVDSKDIVVVRV